MIRTWLGAATSRRWRSWLVLGLLIGALVGGMTTAVAGARRTSTAVGRFLEKSVVADAMVTARCEDRPRATGNCTARLRAVPGVADLTTIVQIGAQFPDVGGKTVQPVGDTCYGDIGVVLLVADPANRYGAEINRVKLSEGRLADPTAADEVVITRELSRRLDLHAGDVLKTSIVSYEKCQDDPSTFPAPRDLRIVGVGISGYDVRPSSGFFITPVLATPALLATPAAKAAAGIDELSGLLVLVRLDDHGDRAVERFVSAAKEHGIEVEASLERSDHASDLTRAVDPSAQGLRLVAVLAALAGLAVIGQLLVRQSSIEATDLGIVRAFGASPTGLVVLGTVWVLPVLAVSTVTAVVTAFATSSLTPIGLARTLEPSPGARFDAGILAVVVLVSSAAVLLIAAGAAARNARIMWRAGAAPEAAPSRMVDWAAAAALPPSTIAGLHFALRPGRGRYAVPVRSGLLALVLGVTATVAALTFGAGLVHLVDTPRLAGWNWDLRLDYPSSGARRPPKAEVERALAGNRGITDFAPGTMFAPFPGRPLQLGADRLEVGLVAFEPTGGTVGPSITRGRAPVGPDEILLGAVTAADIDVDVGDRIDAYGQTGAFDQPETYRDTHAQMRVVGIGVLPLGGGQRLGQGASVTSDGLSRLAGSADPDSLFVRFRPGADQRRVVRALYADLGLPGPTDADIESQRSLQFGFPNLDVRNVRSMPPYVVALMAGMALAVLLHVLVTSTALRRRDMSVLQTLGFRRCQIRRSIAAQAAALTALAVAIGLPLGLVLGRQVWLAFANRLHVVPEAPSHVGLVVAAPVALVAGQLVAVIPAWVASRRAIVGGLRTESP